jgi:eukaryotic-like serine/threonine-protein kinase
MGVVYRAVDLEGGQPVAIKTLADAMAHDLVAIMRFKREARTAASISHPNICQLHDIGTDGHQLYLVMELLEGETLRARLARGSCPAGFVLSLARQAAEGLRASHASFVVHRDINPSNLFVTSSGLVKILDFGIAKHFAGLDTESDTHDTITTAVGAVVGTVDYMAPEQLLGRRVDQRSDLFALGSVVYEALAGRPPFRGRSNVETVAGILHHSPAPLQPMIHGREWAHVLSRLLAKTPDARYQNADALLDDLIRLERLVAETPEAWAPSAPVEETESSFSVAILPFAGPTEPDRQDDGSSDVRYFCHELTAELFRGLTRIEHIRVVPPTLARRLKSRGGSLAHLGRRLRADTLLTGRVEPAGDRLTIAVTLFGVQEEAPLWEYQYEGSVNDLFRIRDAIVRSVAGQFGGQAQRPTRGGRACAQDPRAFRLYLQGKFYWSKRYQGGLGKARQCFEEAIREDPTSALAHAGLADTDSFVGFYCLMPPRAAFGSARTSVEQALRLDSGLPEAQTSVGLIRLGGDWDFDGAAQAFRAALSLDPAQALARIYLSWVLVLSGRIDEAHAEAERAQDFDPMSPILNAGVGYTFFLSRAYDRAIRECEKALEVDGDFLVALYVMGMCYAQKDMYTEAVNQLERAVELSHGMPFYLGLLGTCYARTKQLDKVAAVLTRLEGTTARYVPPHCHVYIHAALGDIDRAFEWQDRAFVDGASPFNYFSPIIECLHADPRFREDLRAWGLDV